MRFWPAEIPEQIASLAPLFETFCVLTMLYLAFVGYSSSHLRDKLFSYIFIYYLLYLLGIFAPTTILQRNLAYSLFAFLLVFAALSMLIFHIEEQGEKTSGSPEGILCLQPKASFAYGALLLAAIGFPVSALFWNNFIIVSQILTANLYIGTAAVFTILLAAVFMLQNLYGLQDKSCLGIADVKVSDIDNGLQMVYANALRGTGYVKPMMYIAFFSYFVISLPISYVFGISLGYGIVGIWSAFPVCLTVAAFLYLHFFRKKVRMLEEE